MTLFVNGKRIPDCYALIQTIAAEIERRAAVAA